MSTAASLQNLAAKPKALSNATHAGLLLQRKCACGSPTSSLTGECAECKSKKRLQTKLVIGADNDPLEQEADRVADQVLAKPSQAGIDKAPTANSTIDGTNNWAAVRGARQRGSCTRRSWQAARPHAKPGYGTALRPRFFEGARAFWRVRGGAIGTECERLCLHGRTQHRIWCGTVFS